MLKNAGMKEALSPTHIDSVKEGKVSANPLASLVFLPTDSVQTPRRFRKV